MGSVLSSFFGVFVRPDAWLRAAWMALALPIGIAWLTYLTTGLSLGLGLAVTLIGIPVLVGVLFLARAMAALEGRMAAVMLRADIAPATFAPAGRGFWARLRRLFTDSLTWRGLLHGALRFPIGLATFVGVVVATAVSLALMAVPFVFRWSPVRVFEGQVTSWGEALLCFACGFLLLTVMLHAINGAGWLLAQLARALLSPSRADVATPAPPASPDRVTATPLPLVV